MESLTRVRVREFQARPVRREIVINGRTAPNRAVDLRAETDGRVVALGADRGSRVSKGDLIARLDLRDRKARLVEARAAVKQHALQYEAARKLRRKEFFSETQLAEVKARLEAARAAVERIEIDIAHTTVRAPFDGVLQERAVELGDFVDVGNAVARLVDDDPLVVIGEASEQEVGRLAAGDTGTAVLVTGETVEGKIRYIATEADDATRTFRVELTIPNSDGALHAGVTTEIRLTARPVTAHYISSALLALDDSGAVGVKGVDGRNVVRFYPVEIVRSSAEGVWVTGLPEKVRLITVGQGFVHPGDTVDPVAENEAA
ncbi:MAG: efflux RND transporter periplasmic adaptor subunit [Gammaproteobacteria bacterium]|nr:efflux RND transporter periplasmic adaptor subunit [Gammaproteobacteria bacterium]NIR84728.1 efflux RND transporter periplasmic adaptor subunit [Gammaproteobacteria bacterium]NIU03304.1 efflux RND transporter periplasmic adaptor subunit [Gammaproteobacteria bacterium]NIV50796.1 efflux RND transporter periplasmic adaptor subunit [Gammaproteobacteria bacterium]NIV76392.1 efflux RND transporter periplasmic adaptor subunit [Gammaproteobacteria bacterium]